MLVSSHRGKKKQRYWGSTHIWEEENERNREGVVGERERNQDRAESEDSPLLQTPWIASEELANGICGLEIKVLLQSRDV